MGEIFPTGVVVPTAEFDPLPLFTDLRALKFDATTATRMAAIWMEFVLYAYVYGFLAQASDEMARLGSLQAFMLDGWNQLDIINVIIFVMVLLVRAAWMLMADSLTYKVYENVKGEDALGYTVYSVVYPDELDYDEYFKVRVICGARRFGYALFSVGVMVNFF